MPLFFYPDVPCLYAKGEQSYKKNRAETSDSPKIFSIYEKNHFFEMLRYNIAQMAVIHSLDRVLSLIVLTAIMINSVWG